MVERWISLANIKVRFLPCQLCRSVLPILVSLDMAVKHIPVILFYPKFFLVGPTQPAISDKSFCLEQESRAKIYLFSFMDNQSTIFAGIIISVAIAAAFKAGQVCGLHAISHRILQLDFEKLNQKTESLLGKLLEETVGNVQLPQGLTLRDMVNQTIFNEGSIEDRILALNESYLDLLNYGATSKTFLSIVTEYSLLPGPNFFN